MKWKLPVLTRTLDNPFARRDELRLARYGVIATEQGRLVSIQLRRWPRIATALEASWIGRGRHRSQPGGRCWLYYNQPRGFDNFLALKYVVSQRDCTLATFHRALEVLDEVARLKGTDAILCDAWNVRISDRLLARWGWEAHRPSRAHRHFIKRFYGTFPPQRDAVRPTAAEVSAC
jgi:hypothetical protein